MADIDLIKSAIEEMNLEVRSFQDNSIDEDKLIETLPDDCTYHIKELSGVQGKLKAVIQTETLLLII